MNYLTSLKTGIIIESFFIILILLVSIEYDYLFLQKNKIMPSRFKYKFLLILIAAFFTLIIVFFMQLNIQTYIFGDSYSYIFAAKELYSEFKFHDHRPLVISFINGLPLLFGFNEKILFVWSFIINYMCWLSTILLIFEIGKEYFSIKKSFVFAVFYIFCIGNFFIIFHLLSETIFIFLLILVLYFLIFLNKTKKINFLIYSINVLILMSMIKPLSIGLIFILLFIYFKDLKQIFISKYSFFILISLSILSLQLIKMKKEYGDYTISYIDGVTYYNYLGTRADCLKNNLEFIQGKNDRVVKLKNKSMMEIKLIAKKDLKEQLTYNKYNLIKAFIINIINNTSKGSAAVHSCENIKKTNYFKYFSFTFKAISKFQNIIFTILGFILSMHFLFSKTTRLIKFISIQIIYFILISAISSDQGDRFHIVFFPVIIILIIIEHFKIKKTITKKLFIN